MDKKMIKYVCILVGLLILGFFILWLSSQLKNGGAGKKYTYNDVENKIAEAAKKYADKNPGILPTALGTSTILSTSSLIDNGYLKDLSSYISDDVNCNGSVEIFMAGNDIYNYIPELICGTKYETSKLVNKVLEDNNYGEIQGPGLYLRVDGRFVDDYNELVTNTGVDDFEYIFRGDSVNNYVKIDDNVWRIISIDSYNNMLMIFDSHTQKVSAWDDRFNDSVNKNQGINNYSLNRIDSRIKTVVDDFYNGNVALEDRIAYSDKTKYLTVTMDLCIGKRSKETSDLTGVEECSDVLENQYVGLLPAYYYMSASLDPGCTSIVSKNCGNFNYLSDFDDYWWLLTANSENSYESYVVSKKYVEPSLCSYKASVKPIIKIGSRAIYESGNGSASDPYVIKFVTN